MNKIKQSRAINTIEYLRDDLIEKVDNKSRDPRLWRMLMKRGEVCGSVIRVNEDTRLHAYNNANTFEFTIRTHNIYGKLKPLPTVILSIDSGCKYKLQPHFKADEDLVLSELSLDDLAIVDGILDTLLEEVNTTLVA